MPSVSAPTPPDHGRHHVVVLAIPPVIGFDATIPVQAFSTAVDAAGQRLYRVSLVTPDDSTAASTLGYGITPSAPASALASADTVVIPGTRNPVIRDAGRLDDATAAALDLVPDRARWMSICTGAFALAAAGRLRHRPATTHWASSAQLAAEHPDVRVDPSALFIDDGDVLTSAGLAAGIDLCLHVLRRDHGAAVANAVARHLVVPAWRDGGQAQFIEAPLPDVVRGGTASVRAWMLENLDRPIALAEMARQASMSVRTFTRRFRIETGQTPGEWLIRQRVARAAELLETTDLPIERVATSSGLGSPASLRHHLKITYGLSPLAYRKSFGGEPIVQPESTVAQ
ncbi:GlxA family transcriptional regulator [Microlunatus soli]|uniref:Transcriptional regulator GlxA family, contains an amidase domain and an AraC-type DNA-binding HTH domain n=1 Tax=Microlunatus soli TaxID=630515 RepID=A0A1H1T8E6_9ACTN|nr:helix-turn-helix domain-containing protein [Microlunatus soli]SDS56535.1 Transcriptional regulator GlxA family, contains an amidase domain and an AraC-type DNA-binding HTH domain [Microlunatus soli]